MRQLQSKCERSHSIIETSAEEIKNWANQEMMNTERTYEKADEISRLRIRLKEKEKTVIIECLMRSWTHRWKIYQKWLNKEYNWAAEKKLSKTCLQEHINMSKAESSVLT